MTDQNVSWGTYASKYDMLLQYNPYYQKLQQEVLEETYKWKLEDSAVILDIGAGTGNYSVPLGKHYPKSSVIHIDNDKQMNDVAFQKANTANVSNVEFNTKSISDIAFEHNSISGVVSVHALYTFPDPKDVIQRIYNWLKPGANAILVDAGRIVNVLDWQFAIGFHLIKTYGISKTIKILKEGKEVSKQNALIREMQKRGDLWVHSHEEFSEAIQNVGFKITKAYTTFRGVSDFVVVEK